MIIKSILDNDLYKFTQGAAVANQYPRIEVEYKLIWRTPPDFDPTEEKEFCRRLREEVELLSKLKLDDIEEQWVRDVCYYLKPPYIDFLRAFRFNPDQVSIVNSEDITAKGPWYQAIYWEVVLMALVSEIHYEVKGLKPEKGWINKAARKFSRLSTEGVTYSDFGTRRRFSFDVHARAVELMSYSSSSTSTCMGTSNLHLARLNGLLPVGTMAHEWIQAHAAMFGYRMATQKMLESWVKEYEGQLGIALPDTFTSEVFFRDFNTLYAKLFDLRWDSGDPYEFTDKAITHYKSLRIDPASKIIVYSNALNTDRAIAIHKYAEGEGIIPRFGIGTHFSNDVGHKPLNFVIKMIMCNGVQTIKLPDDPGKVVGSKQEISLCKQTLGIE